MSDNVVTSSEEKVQDDKLHFYKQMVESTPMCIKVFDGQGKLLFINKGGRVEHFIKDTDDITKWDWVGTVKKDYQKQVFNAFQKGLQGEASRVEMEHTPEGASHAWCEGIISPIIDPDGKVNLLLFYSLDITEKKLIEKELKYFGHKWQTLIDNISVGIYRNTPGPQGHFLEANPAILAMFEADSKEEFLKHNVSDIYQNPEERAKISEKIQKNGFIKNEEISFTTLKGKNFIGSVTAVMKKDENGTLYFDGIVEDITERKHLEQHIAQEKEIIEQTVEERTQQLSNEQARLQASINNLTIGYLMTANDNQLIMINKAAKDILTLSTPTASPAEKAIDVTDLKEKIDIEFIQNSFKDSFDLLSKIEESKKNKSNIVLKDIHYKMLHLNLFITPIIDGESNDVIGSVLLIEDITEQKVLDRSRDEFFSIASHELRTPLTAIRGNTSMLIDYFDAEINNPDIKDIIADIHESSLRLVNIVNDFLDLSRLEQGKIQYTCETFEIIKLCEDVLKEYDVTGSQKKLYLRIDQPKDPLPLVYADKNRVRQAIVNLLGNALKFTTQGGVAISFEAAEHNIKVLLTDTGKGISENNQILLFRKFQQAQSNILTRETSTGTGLGLYISRLMIREMGGDVTLIKSEPEKGSTFCVIIPVATDSQKESYNKSPEINKHE